MSTATHAKTNERPGVRAVHRNARTSATKVRVVLDLIRNKPVGEARNILTFSDRGASDLVIKVLDSAVANAANNNDIPPDELYVAACYADEGPTMNRWRPRARGRATRIRKRTAHITVIVGRYTVTELEVIRERAAATGRTQPDAAAQRARRVAKSKSASESDEPVTDEELDETTTATDEAEVETADTSETAADETAADESAADETAADDAASEAVVEDAEELEAAEDAADEGADEAADADDESRKDED
jgi:large subunit ribosomal protein L22